jgi:hypothetical protein
MNIAFFCRFSKELFNIQFYENPALGVELQMDRQEDRQADVHT